MKLRVTKILLGTLAVGGLVLGAQSAIAGFTDVCSTCHTMHNSQDGTYFGSAATAYDRLLLNSCIGCHSDAGAVDSAVSGDGAPIVWHINNAPNTLIQDGTSSTNHLAGGSFYWIQNASDDSLAHNVKGISGVDGDLNNTPPGNGGTALSTQLVCGDVSGDSAYSCHRATGSHHNNSGGDYTAGSKDWVSGNNTADAGDSYRFLNTGTGANVAGVQGGEDSDWEYTVSTDAHNYYWSGSGADSVGTKTINLLCAKCHGDFHTDANQNSTGSGNSAPWIRHPTDIPLPATGEYAAYNTYDWIAPVGVTSAATTDQTAAAANKQQVLCLSCHRAHGSPNADLLRWSYSQMEAGTGTPAGILSAQGGSGSDGSGNSRLGCFACHTTKGGY